MTSFGKPIRGTLLLTLVLMVGTFVPGCAQQPSFSPTPTAFTASDGTNGGITSVNPPDEDSLCTPGTEKFIILALEPSEESEDMANVWEYMPSRPEIPITRRCEFVETHWAPNLLFWEDVTEAPELVRLQVYEADVPRGYTVNLYRLNYRTWKVETLLQSTQILGLGATKDLAFLKTDKGLRILDRKTGGIETPDQQFRRLWDFDDVWLVKYETSDEHTAHLFSPERNSAIREIALPDDLGAHDQWALSPNKEFIALYREIDPSLMTSPFGLPANAIETEVLLYDLQAGSRQSYPVYVHAFPGSGVPIIHYGYFFQFIDFWFTDDGHLKYLSAIQEGDVITERLEQDQYLELLEEVSVHPATGTVTKQPAIANEIPTFWGDLPIPEYLETEESHILDEQDLAHAFLKHMGVDYGVPMSEMATEVGFSDDGQRFLLRINSSSGAEDFFYGDVEEQTLVRIEDPSKILQDALVYIYCVRCP